EMNGEKKIGREMGKVLRRLKNRKAMAGDGIPNKVWKYEGGELENWATWEFCNKIWKGERWPERIRPDSRKGKGTMDNGYSLSPLLFNLLIADLEEKMRKVKWGEMKMIRRIYTLANIDDMVMLTENEGESMSIESEEYLGRKGLELNNLNTWDTHESGRKGLGRNEKGEYELLLFLQELSTQCSIKYTSSIMFQQILIFVKDNICISTEIVCWIINKLISFVPSDTARDLQDSYFSTLKSYLEVIHIPPRRRWHLNHIIAHSSETDLVTRDKSLQMVLRFLSKIDIDADSQIEFLKTVCPTLSKSYIKNIKLALYSKKNDKLLSEWLLLWNKTHVCFESTVPLLTVYKICESVFELTEDSEILLCKQELLKRTSARKLHWLNGILDICCILTMKGRYSEVELLLSCNLLKRLYSVLLFKVLNDCPQEIMNTRESYDNGISICECINFFLEKCYPDLYNDDHLNKLYALLKNHIRIVVYILQWKKQHFIDMKLSAKEPKNSQSDMIEQIVSIKQILSLLQKHNILFVLKLITDIHDQNYSDIQDLVKEVSLDQSMSFQAYCCIISVLKAIFLCEFYNVEHKQITKYFSDTMSHLSSLFPLSLRIETMENIFSLLFLRYEDFNVTKDDCNIRKSIEYEKSGFIANKYAVRDMLYYLWKSTLITTEEIDKLQVLGSHKEMQQLRENVSTFTSTLIDTRWRLKFHMGLYFFENVGTPQDESDNPSGVNKLESVISQTQSFPHRITGDTFFYKGDNTSDEIKVKSDSSSESGLLSKNKRRKCSRITAEKTDHLITKDKLSLINLMLASKESLIVHCLWKGNFQKAQEVVEMFHMENTQLDGEIRFSEALHTFKQNLYKHIHTLDTIDSFKESSKTSTLEICYNIFDLNTEPDKLEKIASNLQVNLIYSMLVNAYPNISCYDKKKCSSIKDSEYIILNTNQEELGVKNVIKRPNQYISEILAELLQILCNISSGRSHLDNSYLRNISDHTDIRMILNKTSNLASLDLGELSVGDETLTFFLNVWNVMFLHANLDVWSKDPPLESLRHTISLMSIGYIIGDLGLVTLAALRSKLLGKLANDIKFFTRVEELNKLAWQDLDLVQNPRIIFAMANEFYGTPEIRVYEAQTLNDALNEATSDYITHYSLVSPNESVNEPKQKISLLNLVRQYQNTFSRDTDGETNTNRSLPSIADFEKLNEDINLEYMTSNYTYEVILKYSKYNISTVTSTNFIQTSLWQTRILRTSLLQYLERHCWLVSYLVQRMHNENPTILENNYDNVKRIVCLENLVNSPWMNKLKLLFNNNQILAAIHDSVPEHELWHYFELRKDHNWQDSLEVLNALADIIIKYSAELQRFKDLILSHMLSNLGVLSVTNMLQYLYQIKDIHILTQTILHNVNKWPMILCEHALCHVLQHEHNHKLPVHCKHRMNDILCRITIFHKMIPYCMNKSNITWYDIVYCTGKIDPFKIIKSLIDADQFKLCLEWLECQAFSLEMQTPMSQDFLIGLLKNEQQDFKQALKFLQVLPLSQPMKICKGVLKKLESISALQFITNYLLDYCKIAERPKYRKTLIGLQILKLLEDKDRSLYIHLIKEPLLMLEQLLMNCKFENIQNILNSLQENLQHPDIGINNFYEVIKFYAIKSLDFRVSFRRDGTKNKTKNMSQPNLEAENNEFVMPVNVPTKEEWIPNDRARECSCCKAVIFSMFNRRHHCRRCGRVICAMCSRHRVPSTSSNELFDYWRLTKDEKHNRTIREEFSFEYAPNISLCLAILNLYCDSKIYTSFLLDRCDEMKRLLQPVSGDRINPEIDHAVIIKMIRSLLTAAKMKCAKFGFNTGLAHCDRFLSQVDLIATLVQSDCVTLIPMDDLDEHTLRKLRDLLTEKERWTLALDVSTKAGLDTQGVWAAWGKACLKVGHLEQAKEKFQHCLDKITHEDLDDWVMLFYPKELIESPKKELTVKMTQSSTQKGNEISDEEKQACKTGHLRRNEYFKCRPLKDPPLLMEILQILDTLSIHRSRTQQSSAQSKSDTAQEILQTLNSLKAVSQNQFNVKYVIPANQTVYYQESLYYLLAYGSYTSILQFFLRHKEFDKCLVYILDNNIERDLFLNGVYLYCLKNGHVEKLHNAMRTKDPTLVTWRKYLISVCHFMERKQYWHILYQIQLFMTDYVRASMTCIRFYTNEANTYSDLHNRAHLLQDAQKHLELELQTESLTKRRKNINFDHSGQNTLVMEPSEIDRHINTICRQTEIVKFLANCEKEERPSIEFFNLFPDIDSDNFQTLQLPTLFGNQQQKIHLAVLAILCGRDIEEGFGIAFRIIQDYNLPQQKVYSSAGHVLALKNNIAAIEQLIKCCRSSGAPNAHIISDHVLAHCVKLLLTHSYTEQIPTLKHHIDILIRLIIDTELRINAYIENKQLKAAYLLAVKYSRAQDIRRILKESDRLGQSAIKAICLKWLQQKPKK
ncbi:ZFY26 protein, partial [Pseudoatta argentina]